MMQALFARKTYREEDWLVLVTTDHGGLASKTHGKDAPQERTVFIIASGPSVIPGELSGRPGVVDVAVTALAHLGIPLDGKWRLDGQVIGLTGFEPRR